MRSDAIALRNRCNAQKSTGPKTLRGKAIVAGNASKHGATAQPDLAKVVTWLAIILDDPQATTEIFLPDDERRFRALALAQAEARLVAADRALREFEAKKEPSEMKRSLREMKEQLLINPPSNLSNGEIISKLQYLSDLEQRDLEETSLGGKRHRLLKRYRGEARAQKRRAFGAWVTVEGERGRVARVCQ